MAVTGRTFRPVVSPERCNVCTVCIGLGPAYVEKGFRNDDTSVRGKVFQGMGDPPPTAPTPLIETAPPCQATCPIGQDVRGYLKAVAEGRFDAAVGIVRETNPLPLVCGTICSHPCESACFRSGIDTPLAIRNVKRFAALYEKSRMPVPPPSKILHNGHVAIIGSGPAGLAAAYTLLKNGVRPIVYEKEGEIGGMLAWAIPAFRLPRSDLTYEIDYLAGMGVTFVTGKTFGKFLTISGLEADGAHAVLLAIGAAQGKKLLLDGSDAFGPLLDCLDYLRQVHTGTPPELGERVAVIGGGNAAIDTARTLRRAGVPKVTVLYRRSKDQMPADPEEVAAAEKEGVSFLFKVLPTMVVKGANGWRLEGFETRSDSRAHPVAVLKEKPVVIPVTGIVTAVGQQPDVSGFAETEGIRCNAGGLISTDETMQTSRQGVFAAGDGVTGPSTVVEAMAGGIAAARAILSSRFDGEAP